MIANQQTPAAAPARSSTHWPAVLAAVLAGVAVSMNVGKVPIAMPELRGEFGMSLVAAGWLSSMISTLAVTTGLCFGLMGDRVGALRMCLFGLGASLAGGAGALFATTESALLVSRFLEGAGLVSVAVSAPALLSAASHPDDRRFALGIWSGYLPGGVGLVMLLAPLVSGAGGWRAVWVVSMAAALLAALAVWLLRAAYRRPAPAAPAQAGALSGVPSGALSGVPSGVPSGTLSGAKDALAHPVPWLLAFAMATWTTQHYVLIIWLPTFLAEQRGLAPLTVSLLACLMVLVNVPGNMLGGSLLQRHFRRGNLIACASVVTGLCGAGIFLDLFPDLVRYGLCLVLSFIGGLIPASVLSSSASLARTPNQIGTLQGLFIQVGNLGPFIGPPAVAMLVASTGTWQYAFVVSGGAAFLGLVLGLLIRRSAPKV